MFVQDAESITVTGCRFNQTGGNGIILSNHVVTSEISHNEFVHTGDSAIVLLGSSDRIFGLDKTFPFQNVVRKNHVHDYGTYGKQTSCIFQALAGNTTFVDNVCYNGPRAHVNWNDGFYGNNWLEGNLLFNAVRETGDHGT